MFNLEKNKMAHTFLLLSTLDYNQPWVTRIILLLTILGSKCNNRIVERLKMKLKFNNILLKSSSVCAPIQQ